MPAGGRDQIIALELEAVSKKLPILFDRDDVFYSHVEKRPVEVVSLRQMRVPLEIRPGGKSGHFNSDGGSLGRGDMPTYDNAVMTPVELRHAIEWTTRRKWSTDSSRKAIIDAFHRDLASAMSEFRRYVDSLCMTAGNGVLGTIASVSSGGGVDTYTLETTQFGARLLRYGMDINVYNSTLTTNRTAAGERTITYHDQPNAIIKVAAVTGAAATDKIVASGLTSPPPVSILGIPYHISNASTGYWLGFDRSTTPEIRSNGVDAGGAALTLPLPRLAINKIGDRVGINKIGRLEVWTHPCQKAAYEELGFENSVINKSASNEGLDLYFGKNVRIAGLPLNTTYSWNKTRIDILNMETFGRAVYEDVDWYKDENGNKYFVLYATDGGVSTSNVAYIVTSFNLFTSNPAASAYVSNLAVPSGY